MSTVPPAEGSGGDVTKDEATPAADGQPTAGAQGEGRYSSAEGADGDAAPDAPKQEQGGTAAAGAPGAKAGEADAGPQTGTDAPADHQAAAGDDAAAPVETLHGCPLVDSLGAAVVHCNREEYGDLMAGLKADGYNLMVGVSGVDYLSHPGRDLPEGVTAERFEVVVELARVGDRSRLRVRCQVPAADPVLPSLFDLWAGSEAHERETYDMFGISFAGHPDPSRILMPEDWEGHPLRKDYAIGRIPVQFKESPGGR